MLSGIDKKFLGKPADFKIQKQQNVSVKPAFSSNTQELTRIYDSSKTDQRVLTSFRNNALSFGSGMEGMQIKVDPKSGFELEDVLALLRLMNDDTKDLITGLSSKLRPVKGFKGKDLVRIIKSVLVAPEKEKLVGQLIDQFGKNAESRESNLVRTVADILETYNSEDSNQKEIMNLLLACKDLNNSEDLLDILRETNSKTAPILKKVLDKAKDNNNLNGIEVRLIAKEILSAPEKEPILDKLLDKLFQPDNNRGDLAGILDILENFEVKNKAHEEMLDFYIDAKQNFWGLFIAQLLEYTTLKNKERIKQIVNDTPGEGIPSAAAILEKIKKLK